MNHTKIRALLNESQDLLLVEKKRGGFWNSVKKTLGTIAGLGLAGAGAYAGLKYFKPHMLQGLKNKYIAPLQLSGLGTAHYDTEQDRAEMDTMIGKLKDKGEDQAASDLAQLRNATVAKKRELEKQAGRVAGRATAVTPPPPNNESTESTQVNDVKNFINELGQKNYSEADKYLKKVVEDKLQSKIKDQYTKQKLY